MRSPFRLSLAWLAVAAFSIVMASFAVANVRSQVTNVPTVLGSGVELGAAESTATDEIPNIAAPPSTQAIVPTPPTITTTTTETTPSPTTESSQTTASSTTTTSAPVTTVGSTAQIFDTLGGFVHLVVSGESVTGNAFPKSGWQVELKHSGPDKVEVRFERYDSNNEETVEFKAWMDHGELRVDISEEVSEGD